MSAESKPNETSEQPKPQHDQVIVKLNGKTFYCECGCNVFHYPDKTQTDLYECNACETRYRGS